MAWASITFFQDFPTGVNIGGSLLGTKDTIMIRETKGRDGANRVTVVGLMHVGYYEVQNIVTSGWNVN